MGQARGQLHGACWLVTGLSDLRSPVKPQSSTAGAGNPVREKPKVQTSLSRGFQGTWEKLWETQGLPGQWHSADSWDQGAGEKQGENLRGKTHSRLFMGVEVSDWVGRSAAWP